jgi:hypothetical protein
MPIAAPPAAAQPALTQFCPPGPPSPPHLAATRPASRDASSAARPRPPHSLRPALAFRATLCGRAHTACTDPPPTQTIRTGTAGMQAAASDDDNKRAALTRRSTQVFHDFVSDTTTSTHAPLHLFPTTRAWARRTHSATARAPCHSACRTASPARTAPVHQALASSPSAAQATACRRLPTSSRPGTGGALRAHSTSSWRTQFPFLSIFHHSPFLCRYIFVVVHLLIVVAYLLSSPRPHGLGSPLSQRGVETLQTTNTANVPPPPPTTESAATHRYCPPPSQQRHPAQILSLPPPSQQRHPAQILSRARPQCT